MEEDTFFQENDALHGVEKVPKWKNTQKCRLVIFCFFFVFKETLLLKKNQKT